MEANLYTKENQMNAKNPSPVTVVTDNDPTTTEDTVVTARFNRKKIAQIAGAATAALGTLFIFGAVMKERGKNEFLDDVRYANADDETDEIAAS